MSCSLQENKNRIREDKENKLMSLIHCQLGEYQKMSRYPIIQNSPMVAGMTRSSVTIPSMPRYWKKST